MSAPMKSKRHVEVIGSQFSDSGSEADLELSDEEDAPANTDDTEQPADKRGLAAVMAKILQKKVPVHKQVILAKGQTDREIKKRKLLKSEADGDEGIKDEKITDKAETVVVATHEKKKLWEDMCRVKPSVLDKDRERHLQRIATRGVVQLFNAVRKQQKLVEDEIHDVGLSERKKDQVMAGMTKDKFLNILKGSTATNVKVEPGPPPAKRIKTEDEEAGTKKKWTALRDDFMIGAKMKDWDKESSDDGDDSEPGGDDMSDSGSE